MGPVSLSGELQEMGMCCKSSCGCEDGGEMCFFEYSLVEYNFGNTLPKWGVQPALSLNKKLFRPLRVEFSQVS